MTVTLIGIGCGTADTVTREARHAIAGAKLLVGAPRLLEALQKDIAAPDCRCAAAVRPDDILALLDGAEGDACVLFSGDSGFFSGARRLLPRLAGREVRVLPGVSSLQVFAARLGRPWQDWSLCSAHGTDCDAVAEVCHGRPVFFLTGGRLGAAALCRQLEQAGLGELAVTVGEELTLPGECITRGTAAEMAERTFAPLSVVLAEAAPCPIRRAPGLPDETFLRGHGVPMTKQEVRAAILSKLAVGPEDVCWDIGAGTGSVSVELALCSRAVWAVEHKAEALELARRNRVRCGAWKLRLLEGHAPEILAELPRPDAVFVGGSDGNLEAILRRVHEANPDCRVCVAAVTLENLAAASAVVGELWEKMQVTQLAVTHSRAAGTLHLMMAQNPVYLITGERL
jgi:precorrin-6Y C5,15-methyltransferase (decarboxylating)